MIVCLRNPSSIYEYFVLHLHHANRQEARIKAATFGGWFNHDRNCGNCPPHRVMQRSYTSQPHHRFSIASSNLRWELEDHVPMEIDLVVIHRVSSVSVSIKSSTGNKTQVLTFDPCSPAETTIIVQCPWPNSQMARLWVLPHDHFRLS